VPKKKFEYPRVQAIPLAGGYVQYLVDGPMLYPVLVTSDEGQPSDTLNDAHFRFLDVTLPDFADQPVVCATIFVDAEQKGGLRHGDPNYSSLIFLLQSIAIKTVDGRKQITVTAIWDRWHQGVTVDDKRWLSQWSVGCHLIVVGRPHRGGARHAAESKGSKAPGREGGQNKIPATAAALELFGESK
jgi:hypothetical protein